MDTNNEASGKTDIIKPVAMLFFMLFAVALLRNAWLCDDAYITLRTVDNLTHGYGLTWNTAERVQVYTHPLWMMCLSAVYFLTREAYFTTLLLSIGISLMAVYLTAFRLASQRGASIVCMAALIFSKSFLDYSTSGLENPLSHLLVALFMLAYFKRERNENWLLQISLIASLAAVNRLDTILIYAPCILSALRSAPVGNRIKSLFYGFLPLILWELFSLVYYGFPFPNTAYAKLNTDIPRHELLYQGFCYFMNSFSLDPLTLLVILTGASLPFWHEDRRPTPLCAGIGLYLVYIFWVGGDFMSGRFMSAALLGSIGLICMTFRFDMPNVMVSLLLILLCGYYSPHAQFLLDLDHPLSKQNPVIDNKGVADEKAYYFGFTGLTQTSRQQPLPYHAWILEGRAAREKGPSVQPRENIGFYGYYAGPDVHVLDVWALADPLLTRLPLKGKDWRVGHYAREIPEGYLQTLETGRNMIVDPKIALYYDRISKITRGPVFSISRFYVILKMNLGLYDNLALHPDA